MIKTINESSDGFCNQETCLLGVATQGSEEGGRDEPACTASESPLGSTPEGCRVEPADSSGVSLRLWRRCAGHATMVVGKSPSWADKDVVNGAKENEPMLRTHDAQPHDGSATTSCKVSCDDVARSKQTDTPQVAGPQQPGCACQGEDLALALAFALALATRRSSWENLQLSPL